MIYIVEGMDGSGKTTLAHRLAYDLQGCVISNKRKPKKLTDISQQVAIANNVADCMPVVLDRVSLISELVYGQLRTELFTSACMELIWPHVEATVIYCRPAFENLRLEGHQMPGVVENSKKLYDTYDLVMANVAKHHRVVVYDYTTQTYESLKEVL